MKKIFTLAIFFLLCNFVSADNIANYTVLDEVPLDKYVTISGTFLDDLNQNTNVLCDFYILNENGEKIYRLSSRRTDLKGNFYSTLQITEKNFSRGSDYNALTICDQAESIAEFSVIQRETVYNPLLYEFKWITEGGNVYPIVIIGGFILLIVFAVLYLRRVSHTGRLR